MAARGTLPPPEPHRLDTVEVPAPLEPLFLKAQDYVRRYFGDRVERPDRSTIVISGERYILVRAASMSVEFFDLVMSLYRDEGTETARAVASNILFDVAHAIGRADARSFQEKMGVSDAVEKLSAGPVHFAFAGWAFVKILPESRPSPDEEFFLLYEHPFSFESDSWVRRGRTSEVPVCIMNAGYSSGWCEESFGLPLVAAEISCLAAGDDACRFVMAPPSRIEEHLARQPGAAVGPHSRAGGTPTRVTVPEFFRRKRLEDDLRRQQESLERRVAERTAELLRTNELLREEVSERRRSEQQLKLLESAVQNAEEGIVLMSPAADAAGPRIVFVNQGFCRMTGIRRGEAVGETLRVIHAAEADRETVEALHRSFAQGLGCRSEMTAVRKDGTRFALELHAMPLPGIVPDANYWIGILRDVSERKRQLAALEHQALHDTLTDLPNRVLLRDRLEQALLTAGRTKTTLGLLFMDLDRFKEVNDTFGHHYGDLLLRQVGARLRRGLRATDSISRLGGDEFAVVLPLLEGVAGAALAARKILAALEEPFVIEGQSISVGASIGIALYPDHGTDSATLMKRADVAMYVAKSAGTGYAVYDVAHDPYSADRLALVRELKVALETAQLSLVFHPIVSLRDGSTGRVEALVRWDHPERGRLAPEKFLAAAERSGLIHGVTERVLEMASRACRSWRDDGARVGITVNVTARSLQDPGFPERLEKTLHEEHLDPSLLTLEVTEGTIVADPLHAAKVIHELRAMGVSVSVDDFGTGYSSLMHLKKLELDEIKIDRSLVREMARNEGDAVIVRSTIEMAHNFRCRVVAEGVEDETTWRRLVELECDFVQGFYVTEPLDAEELRAWLRRGPFRGPVA